VDVGNGELGLQLISVGAGSPAQRAGLEVGDVIVRVDGVRVRSPEELLKALDQSTGNPNLKVLNVRNGQYVELKASFD
jgi:S1-C subfamily serine protease